MEVAENVKATGYVKGSQLCIGDDYKTNWPVGGECVIVTNSNYVENARELTVTATCPPGKIIKSACGVIRTYPTTAEAHIMARVMFNCKDSPTHSCVGETSCSVHLEVSDPKKIMGYVRILCCD